MGRGQPYLYDAPKRISADDIQDTFNPKAVTMASRRPPPPPKSKPDGPLIDINRHPDSYLVLPYGRTNARPMSPKTKTLVKFARFLQLFFRALQLLGALGVLLCAIFIRGTKDTTEGLIIRIPPGVDVVATLYAIYHLARSAKARAPGSSASYHFFALILDAGFIPFFVFTALLANQNYNEQPGTIGRWRTFFPDDETNKVLYATWLGATAVAGLHCASLFVDLYLVIIFRKISKLPPDMNPLEENLTSRRKTKHKQKNSSISVITPLTAEEKRLSAQSSSTLGSDIPRPDSEKLSFMQTRTNSNVTYSPHNPSSVRHSYQSQAASRRELNHRDDLLHSGASDGDETLGQRKSFLAAQAIKRGSRPNSMISTRRDPMPLTSPRAGNEAQKSGDIAEQKPSTENLQSDNWFIHTDSFDELDNNRNTTTEKLLDMLRDQTPEYGVLSPYEDIPDKGHPSAMVPQPLRMNPPTPPLHDGSGASPSRTSTPKVRYYGDLNSATQGFRNTTYGSPEKHAASPSAMLGKTFSSVRRTGDAGYTPVQNQSPRVVSRSGVDIDGDYGYESDDSIGAMPSGGRNRDVSGKIAEEGRGGRWGGLRSNNGLTYRRVSGVA